MNNYRQIMRVLQPFWFGQVNLFSLYRVVYLMSNTNPFPPLDTLTEMPLLERLQRPRVNGTADYQAATATNRIHRSVLIASADALRFSYKYVSHS
jgi:hypothetical protein